MTDQQLLPTGSTGVYVAIEDDGAHRESAAELERLGYDTLWLAGGQIDALGRIDEIVDATTDVRVGSGIVALGVHDIDAIAAHRAALQRSNPGRYVLGLGGPQQAKPMAALRGYLDELDEAGVGANDRMLAALGPKKLAVAAERAAGAITLMTSPQSTADARRMLGPDPVLAVHLMTAADDDLDRARNAVRPTISFLAQVAGYRTNVQRMGFTDRDLDEVNDRLVDAVAAVGDEDAVADRIAEHRAAGADEVALSIFPVEGGRTARETAAVVAGRLGLAS